jgi:hypothetical protein
VHRIGSRARSPSGTLRETDRESCPLAHSALACVAECVADRFALPQTKLENAGWSVRGRCCSGIASGLPRCAITSSSTRCHSAAGESRIDPQSKTSTRVSVDHARNRGGPSCCNHIVKENPSPFLVCRCCLPMGKAGAPTVFALPALQAEGPVRDILDRVAYGSLALLKFHKHLQSTVTIPRPFSTQSK